eukprot:1634788-Pyramimonas_sp.AAC.1
MRQRSIVAARPQLGLPRRNERGRVTRCGGGGRRLVPQGPAMDQGQLVKLLDMRVVAVLAQESGCQVQDQTLPLLGGVGR